MTLTPALYLIPVPLGDTPVERVLPPYNREVILGLRHFIVENVRSARRFLKKTEPTIDIDALTFYELNRHTSPQQAATYVEPLAAGEPMGVVSEAGCPAVADPGADIVAMAQKRGLRVVPLVGPSSILMSVMGAGFNGQSFAFNGYLPIDDARRADAIRRLEQRAYAEDQTQLCIETPYRNQRLMQELLRTLRPQTRLCMASDITCADERIVTRTVEEWRRRLRGASDELLAREVPRVPAIFLFYKP